MMDQHKTDYEIPLCNLSADPNKWRFTIADLIDIVRLEREEICKLIEARRIKVLTSKDDPSWTEHFAELQSEIRYNRPKLPNIPEDGK